MNAKRNLLLVPIALVVLIFALQTARAQANQTSRIRGLIVDANGARITGALITVESTHFRRQLETNEEGKFQVELPADAYHLSVEKAGFKKWVSSFRTQQDSIHNLTVRMKVQAPTMPLKIKETPD
jgi:uncharacterized membrane protein